jgi:hypothetical protein
MIPSWSKKGVNFNKLEVLFNNRPVCNDFTSDAKHNSYAFLVASFTALFLSSTVTGEFGSSPFVWFILLVIFTTASIKSARLIFVLKRTLIASAGLTSV